MRKTYTRCGASRYQSKLRFIRMSTRKIPRTTKEIADMFGIQSKDVSRTTQMFKDNIMGVNEKNYVTKAFDVMQRLLNSFE